MTAAAFPVPVGTAACHPRWHAGHAPSDAVPSLRWLRIDPCLRGRITPALLAALAARGLHVHRVGAAAYVHDDAGAVRWVLAVAEHGAPAPAFMARLDAHHAWMRRRGGAPLPAERARDAAWWDAWALRDRVQPWCVELVVLRGRWKVRADW